ncbi:hypothetical protein BDN70DRAFT_886573 [Pholiota conissans]|uniref:Uncharacterized protein n=1 Tax=Pholiota conissans TaxID=109636 RepID=A0A9P6CT83_9AGAR|nr:hypothetical protein BDN70DRAFT_886572 [Pholiota conissans]KAF9472781.1 hypothetical protein BDN70DRAFT_886573 [Pholiota conissans]
MASSALRPPSFEQRFPYGVMPNPENWRYNRTAAVAFADTGSGSGTEYYSPMPSHECNLGGSTSTPIESDLFRDCIEDYGLDAVQPLRAYTMRVFSFSCVALCFLSSRSPLAICRFGYQTLFHTQSIPVVRSNPTQPFGATNNTVINRKMPPHDQDISSTANDEENWTPDIKSEEEDWNQEINLDDLMTKNKPAPARRSARLSAVSRKEGEGSSAATKESFAPDGATVEEETVFLNRNGKPVKNSRFWTYTTQ